jgi:outer membrane protein TolC
MKYSRFLILTFSCSFLFSNLANANQVFFTELKKMREKNLTLQARSARLQSSNDSLTAKKLFWLPTLTLSGGVQKSARNMPLTEGTENPYWKASSTWNLFSGGADYNLKQATQLQDQAEKYNYQNENLKTDTQLAGIIFQQLYLNDVIKSAQNLVKLREESHRIVLEKYKAGKSPYQEVEKSEIDKNQQETRLRNLQIENIDNQTQWKALFGDSMNTNTWPFKLNQNPIDITSNTLGSGSYHLIPELGKLESLSSASEYYWKSAKGSYWPQVDLAVDYQANLAKDDNSKIWTGGLYLTIPLWSKYETAAKVSSAYADYLGAKSQFETAKNLNEAKKESIEKKIQLTRKNLEEAKNNLVKSEKLYDDMLKSFRFGRISMNELLIEQNRLIDSQMILSQSEWDFHKILLEACAILGQPIDSCL